MGYNNPIQLGSFLSPNGKPNQPGALFHPFSWLQMSQSFSPSSVPLRCGLFSGPSSANLDSAQQVIWRLELDLDLDLLVERNPVSRLRVEGR